MNEQTEPKQIEITQQHIHPDCCAIELRIDEHVVRLEGPTPETVMRLYELYRQRGGTKE